MKKLFGLLCVMFFLVGMLGAAHAISATPVIQEVYYDEPGTDGDDVFTEIYGEPELSLDNYYLKGINGANDLVYKTVDLTGAVLSSNGLLVIAGSGFTMLPAGSYFIGDVDWQNGPDAVQLWYDDGISAAIRYDALAYGGVAHLGEGSPALDAPSGQSLSRFFGYDTDDNSVDFSVSSPTPGVVPIPCAAWLLGSGLIGIVGVRRKLKKYTTEQH